MEINLTGGTDRTRKFKILTEIFGLKRNFGQEKYWKCHIFQQIYLSHKHFRFEKNFGEKCCKLLLFSQFVCLTKISSFEKKCLGEISKMSSFYLIFWSHRNFRFGNKLDTGGKFWKWLIFHPFFVLQNSRFGKKFPARKNWKWRVFNQFIRPKICWPHTCLFKNILLEVYRYKCSDQDLRTALNRQ